MEGGGVVGGGCDFYILYSNEPPPPFQMACGLLLFSLSFCPSVTRLSVPALFSRGSNAEGLSSCDVVVLLRGFSF